MRQHRLHFGDQQAAFCGQPLVAVQLHTHPQVSTNVDVRRPLHRSPNKEMIKGRQIAVEAIGFILQNCDFSFVGVGWGEIDPVEIDHFVTA